MPVGQSRRSALEAKARHAQLIDEEVDHTYGDSVST